MPPKKPPLAPAALTAQAVSPTEIHLRWNRVNNVSRYIIERALGDENFGAPVEVPKDVTEFDARQLQASTRYRFRTRASNNFGSSPYSNIVAVTTPAVSVPPVEPHDPPPSEPPPIVIPPVEPPPVVIPPIEPLPPLTASDLAFAHLRADGVFALPNTGLGIDVSFGRGVLAGRVVNGQTRLFIHGKEGGVGGLYPILEMTPPAVLPQSLSAAVSAPPSGRAAVVHNWGSAVYGATQAEVEDTWQEAGGSYLNFQTGLCYANGKLFYSLSHSYNTNNTNDRHLGYAELDTPSVGLTRKHGPWRTLFGPQVCAGRLFAIPRDLALQYFGGRTIGIGAATISGTAGAPFGISFVTISEPSLTLEADDRLNVQDVGLTDAVIAARCTRFTRMNMARFGVRRKLCGWQDPGNHAVTVGVTPAGATQIAVTDTRLYAQPGSVTTYGEQTWFYVHHPAGGFLFYTGRSTPSGPGFLTGVPTEGAGSIGAPLPVGTPLLLGNYDNGRGAVLVDSDGTWGPVGVGSSDVATYYDYPGPQTFIRTQSGKQGFLMLASLCDTVPGVDYGTDDTCHVWYGAGRTCPHGQTASTENTSPGPKAASTVPLGLLFRLSEIAEVQDGTRTIANLAPYDAARLHDLAPLIPSPEGRETVAGCWFDDVHNDLYVSVLAQDTQSIWSIELPLIHRFHVVE